MIFKIVDILPSFRDKNIVYLINDNWDDWFEFETVYIVNYQNSYIGKIKIGRIGQTERRAPLPAEFTTLPEDYFSLGTNIDYYSSLKAYETRENILTALKDIAYDLDLFNRIYNERVTKISLLREISPNMIRGQLHRIADGGATLTNYNFKYILPDKEISSDEYQHLDFFVDIEHKTPPSNIHVLIGNNGIGKTTILKSMIFALVENNNFAKYGKFETGWNETFSNVINISFSAFDMPIFQDNLQNSNMPYTYVGLIKSQMRQDGKLHPITQSRGQLAESFFENYYKIITCQKQKLWNKSIDILETDTTFQNLHIKDWANQDGIENYISAAQKLPEENDIDFKKRIHKQHYQEKITSLFISLSSGHKNILLTLASLVNLVEEKTLVLLDEPEEHLHPPLVSAFIHALSDLLSYRNGVAIIATHSPVIVQEVPRKCVWILRRAGIYRKFERPEIETFGENLGELTTEIFGYDVLNSGFHKILKDIAKQTTSYNNALEKFQGELGNEAKSILKTYIYEREQND